MKQYLMLSGNQLQAVLNLAPNLFMEFTPNSTLCYQKIYSKQCLMLSEMKVENCLEIRHSTFDKNKQQNFLLSVIFNGINVEVGVDFFPEVLSHQYKADAYSIDTTE